MEQTGDNMKIGFIGAGKVGFSLGRYFSENGIALSGYYSRSFGSAKEAADFTGTDAFEKVSELIAASDTVFITVPDGTINSVWGEIRSLDLKGKMICHCSGAMTADEAFPDAALCGARCFSVHPLFPVSSKYDSYKLLGEAFFCIEGDEDGISVWQELFSSFGNKTRLISGECKTEYHAACVVSSNLMCGLAQLSLELMQKCGFTEQEALEALRPLAMSNMQRLFEVGPNEALTGPVERNDVSTVKKHLECFETDNDRAMYTSVSQKLTEIAQKRHPDSDYSKMRSILLDK